MGKPTLHQRGLVLKKTRLKESDLIITLLAEDGSLIRAVANGARKPKSALGPVLELFAIADLLVRSGRTLSTIVEAKLVESHRVLRASVEASFAAAINVDLASRIAQDNLPLARLYDATCAGLSRIATIAAPTVAETTTPDDEQRAQILGLSTALLIKALAYAGLRPSFSRCVVCGDVVETAAGGAYGFSALEGGVLCAIHSAAVASKRVAGSELWWAHYLLHEPFDAVIARHPDLKTLLAILGLMQDFIAAHTGYPLRSIDVLIKSHLFSPLR